MPSAAAVSDRLQTFVSAVKTPSAWPSSARRRRRSCPIGRRAAPALSVVVPCYNESEALPLFMVRMIAACEAAVGSSYELLLINDGSKDGTWPLIESLSAASPRVVGIDLGPQSRGHQLAGHAPG